MEQQNRRPTAPNDDGGHRRRKYIINSAFQWKYALTIAVSVFLIVSLISSVLYGLLHHQARQRLIHPESYTAEVTLVMVLFGAALSTITAAAVGVWCLVVTHRICGPLYLLENKFIELANGHIPQLRALRSKDEFKELFAAFGTAVDSMKVRKQAELTRLTKALTVARSALNADDETRKDTLLTIAGHLDALRSAAAETLGECRQEPAAPPPSPSVRRPSVAKSPVATG